MPTVKDIFSQLNDNLHALEATVRDASAPLADAIGNLKGRVQIVMQHADAGVQIADEKLQEFLHKAADFGAKPGSDSDPVQQDINQSQSQAG